MSVSEMRKILDIPGSFWPSCHVLYPADEESAHFTRFFSIDEIARREYALWWIVEDLFDWLRHGKLLYSRCEAKFDVIFGSAQAGTARIIKLAASRLQMRYALWEYGPGGRFGDKVVEGNVRQGDKVLIYNGVTQQGRCIGSRLPGFVESLGAEVIAAAVFAKGTGLLVREAQRRYGMRFYAAVEVDIPVFSALDCPRCAAADIPLIPWTELVYRKEI